MRILVGVVGMVGALVLGACGGGSSSQPQAAAPLANSQPAAPVDAPPPSETEQAMAAMRGFADDMCRCTTSPCVQEVSDRMTTWAQQMAAKANDAPALTEAEQQEATRIGTRMGECMQKAMAAPSPTP